MANNEASTLDPSKITAKPQIIFNKHINWVLSANETTLVVGGKKVFVSASDDSTVRFFTIDPVNHTTSEVAIFGKHTEWVESANETTLGVGDKKVFVSASYDNTVRFFTIDPVNHTTSEVAILRPRDGIKGHEDRCLSAIYIPGQKLLIASTGTYIDSSVPHIKKKFLNAVLFWDLSEAVTGYTPDTGGARAAARAMAADIQSSPLNDLDLEKTALATTLIGAGKDIDTLLSDPHGVSFSNDGKSIAVANNSNNTVSIIDLKTKTLALTIGEGYDINPPLSRPDGVSFSNDGKSIAVANCGNNTVSIIDLETKTRALTTGVG
ncbi:MAG: hypothetical protein NTY34_03355, partial [Candidatus Omnitrophica bacterium]|nr:hypothetical protein [Candidatus Omnitrophota bacterium]